MKTKGNSKLQPVFQAITSTLRRTFTFLVGILLFTLLVAGQSDQSNPRFTEGDINDGAQLGFDLPLGKYPGRGIDVPVSLAYSSTLWKMEHIGRVQHATGVTQSVNEAIYSKHAVSGWKSSLTLPIIEFPKSNSKYDYKGKSYDHAGSSCFNFRIREVYIHMPNGTTHTLRKSDQPSNDPASVDMSNTFYAVDGSRMRFDANGTSDTGTIRMPDGTRYILGHPISKIVDRHNNEIIYNETTRIWTDTIGRQIANPLPATPAVGNVDYYLPGLAVVGTGQLKYTFKWKLLENALLPDGNGAPPPLKVVGSEALPNPYSPPSSGNYPAAQSAGPGRLFQSTPWVYGTNGPLVSGLIVGKGYYPGQLFNPVVLAEIVLPNGTSYKFSYNVYGELDKIVYPTGAYDTYQHTGYPPSSSPPEDVPGQERDEDQQPYVQSLRWITSRKQSANGTGNDSREWTYLNSPGLDGGGFTAITAPDGTREEIQRFDAGPKTAATTGSGGQSIVMVYPFGFKDAKVGMIASKKLYAAPENGGGLLRRELYQYDKSTYNYTITCTLGSTSTQRTYPLSRTPRLTRMTSIVFEGGGDALAQSTTRGYDTTYEMSTGIDQINAAEYGYVVLSNNVAQTAAIESIPLGTLSKSSETTFLTTPTYRDANILGLETLEKVKDAANTVVSQTETLYDEPVFSPAVGRALPTSEKVWVNPVTDPNAYVIERTQYDFYGNEIAETDARGNVAVTTYDLTYHAFPISEATAIPDPSGENGSNTAFQTDTTFDPTTGLVLSITDANDQTIAFEYNDPLLRKTKTIAPNGHQTVTEYGATGNDLTRWIKVWTQIDSSQWSLEVSWLNGVGSEYKTEQSDSEGTVYTETEFDNMGRVSRLTNPYRIGETKLWTEREYDNLGRVNEITHPDGSKVLSAFSLAVTGSDIGRVLTTTNEGGNQRRSLMNAHDQVIRMDEPDGSGSLGAIASPNLPTYYGYNTLGELIKATQESQNRYFLYDSLGRLLRVRQPEQAVNPSLNTSGNPDNNQWSAGFTYDNNENLLTSTNAKGVVTTYVYDALDRVVSRSYTDGTPPVTFKYDNLPHGLGKLIEVDNTVSISKTSSFDSFGRMSSYQQITDGRIYTTSFQYNLLNEVISETYPSGKQVNYDQSSFGDLTRVWAKTGNNQRTYASSFSHTAAQSNRRLRLGNGLWETTQYNPRLQPVQMGLGKGSAATDILKLNNEYGQLNSTGIVDTAKNSGNIARQTITVTGMSNSIMQEFKYDALDRLVEAREKNSAGTQNWIQNFVYDRYGNRTAFSQTIGTQQTTVTPTINPLTNRFSAGGYSYDLNGNLIQDAEGRQFTFNGDNKQVQVKDAQNNIIGTYYYDGEGKRVKRVAGSETTIFVYANGRIIQEYSTQLAQNPSILYITQDGLGSTRVVSDSQRRVVSRRDFMPFGEAISVGVGERSSALNYGVSDDVRQKFTGYQKDSETGLDFAEARMYDNRYGRFTAVDPLLASGKSADPQTFNRYVYVINNPLKFTDPTGLLPVSHWVEQCPGGCWSDMPDIGSKKGKGSSPRDLAAILGSLDYIDFDTDSTMYPRYSQRQYRPRRGGGRGRGGDNRYYRGRGLPWDQGTARVPPRRRTLPRNRNPRDPGREGGPVFGGLKDHAERHSGLMHNIYKAQAAAHMTRHHWRGQMRYNGENRTYYVSLTGSRSVNTNDAVYMFTSTSTNGRRIYTHMIVDYQYLQNKGITLPENMRPVGRDFVGPIIEPRPIDH